MWSRLREVFARELVVLVDPTNPQHARRRKQLTASVGAMFTLGMAAAMGVAPRSAFDDPRAPRVNEPLRMPDVRDQLEQLTDIDTDAVYVRQERMQRGDTISSLLRRLGVDDPDAQAFILRTRPRAACSTSIPARPCRRKSTTAICSCRCRRTWAATPRSRANS